ncbi:hypothetical protein S245_004346 [Arachis hypogaea]
MDNQRNHLHSFAYFCPGKSMEELKLLSTEHDFSKGSLTPCFGQILVGKFGY